MALAVAVHGEGEGAGVVAVGVHVGVEDDNGRHEWLSLSADFADYRRF